MEDSNKLNRNNDWLLIFFKLLADVLFLLILVLAGLLLVDGLLPGFLDPYLSFTKIILLIFLICSALLYIAKKRKFNFAAETKGKKIIIVLVIFLIILTINSLLKFSLWEVTVITAVTLAIFYYLERVIFE